jgi:hypothetical protein
LIHYHECLRCTHQWQTSCMGELMLEKDEKPKWLRHLWSHLCHDCFDMLEKEEISGLPVFELYFYLHEKADKYSASKEWRVVNKGTAKSPFYVYQKFSGMCHEHVSNTYNEDGSIKVRGNFEWGQTAEHKQLREIQSEVEEIYRDIIKAQRTPARIELDEFHKTKEGGFGYFFWGANLRPEGFVGDPPGKARFEVLFGLDPASGELVPPTIVVNGEK